MISDLVAFAGSGSLLY